MVKRTVAEGVIVVINGHEFIASDVRWYDCPRTGRRTVRFVGRCTDSPANDRIRATGYDGGVYGGNDLAGYVE